MAIYSIEWGGQASQDFAFWVVFARKAWWGRSAVWKERTIGARNVPGSKRVKR
jgi:hypothetical protein